MKNDELESIKHSERQGKLISSHNLIPEGKVVTPKHVARFVNRLQGKPVEPINEEDEDVEEPEDFLDKTQNKKKKPTKTE